MDGGAAYIAGAGNLQERYSCILSYQFEDFLV